MKKIAAEQAAAEQAAEQAAENAEKQDEALQLFDKPGPISTVSFIANIMSTLGTDVFSRGSYWVMPLVKPIKSQIDYRLICLMCTNCKLYSHYTKMRHVCIK